MSQYRAYSAYKDSGVEWIGQVPEHWKIAQIKRISTLNPRKSTLSEEKDSLCTFLPMEKLRTNAVTLDETRPIHEVYGGYSYFCDGDILIAKVTPCFENGNIAVANGLVNGIGFGSTEINVLRVNGKGHNRFLYYRLQEEQFRTIAKSEMRGTGGLKRVPTDLFESFTIGLPDTDEQATIVATLDQETARIDALIEKKTRFIELLKEKRQALITHAVTKGLDPNVKMKDSGVEWIGQVPEHWEVKPFKYILSAPMSYGANESAESDDPNHPRYIRITDLTENGTLREDTFKTLPWDKAYSYLLSDGDILLARSGATVGKSFLYRETNGAACFAGYLIKASCDEEKALPKYIYAYLQSHSYWEYISGSNIQSTIQNVSAEKYSSMILPVPQREEQATIAATLDRETARIDALIGKAEQSITLLKERRSAFITAAVTGQIDLRGKQ